MAGFVINRGGTDEEPRCMWFLDIGGPEEAIASAYMETDSEEAAVAQIRKLQEADLKALPIHVRNGEERLVE